jgi:hypothetical protein
VSTFKDDLIRACQNYKAVYVQATAARRIYGAPIVARAGTVDRAASRDVSRTASVARVSSEFRKEPSVFRAASTTRRSSGFRREPLSPHHALSQTQSINDDSRKHMRSVLAYAEDQQPPVHYSPTTSRTPRQLDQESEHIDSQDRDAMVDKYIALQAQEEGLDRKTNDAETERSEIASQIIGLRARLVEAEGNKAALMDEKDKIKAEKRSLQSSLDKEEQLEIGFEAGRRMESKRRKQN